MALLATREMAVYCLQVVQADLTNRPAPTPPPSVADEPSPIFVTFTTLPNGDLRGCIGNFSPSPLHAQLRDYARMAAFKDSRFAPIGLGELRQLECSVSLLHSFEMCERWDDWVVGTHGIRIYYQGYSATYLPYVAKEQGWDHHQTMQSLLKKAGYRGPVDSALLRAVEVERYQVSLASATFGDLKS